MPGVIVTLPARPAVARPDEMLTSPELLAASPDETSTGPVVVDESPESREIAPLEEMPRLVFKSRLPPLELGFKVSPVLITTEPPAPALEFPAKIDTEPAVEDVDLPVPMIIDPDASVADPLAIRTNPEDTLLPADAKIASPDFPVSDIPLKRLKEPPTADEVPLPPKI